MRNEFRENTLHRDINRATSLWSISSPTLILLQKNKRVLIHYRFTQVCGFYSLFKLSDKRERENAEREGDTKQYNDALFLSMTSTIMFVGIYESNNYA